MRNNVVTLLALTSAYLFFCASAQAGSAIVLPGAHENGVNLQGLPISADSIISWEIENSDLVFGSYPKSSDNARTKAIGYMYNQKLEINGGWLENDIRNGAELKGINYEDFFLHFAEDTIIAEVDKTHGENTVLNQKAMIVGYTASDNHAGFWLYQKPPWNADVFENAQQGALYIYHSEMFDRLHFKFSQFAQGGHFSIDYPSAIDANGQVAQWKSFQIKSDKTFNMTKNRAVIWKVPSDWRRATTHDGSGVSYGGGAYFGSQFLRDGGRLYVVRIRWHGSSDDRPRLENVTLKNSFPIVNPSNAPDITTDGQPISRWRKISGFDNSADLDGNNYLSPSEYKKRNNKKATARFRWESRVIPFGRMWNQSSSWSLTNLVNPDYLHSVHGYYQSDWKKQGLSGAYNDDTSKLIGPNQFTVYSGGKIKELGLIVGSDEANRRYEDQFVTFLKKLSILGSNALIGLNISTANMYGRNGQSHLIEAGSIYLREHYLFPSTGFSGYAGIAKFWDNSALAYSGRSVIYQATTRYGRVQHFGNSQDNWQRDQYSALAIYYLNSHSGQSYFNQWNNSYIYGSGNTTEASFWKSGVPKNIAYRPSALLAIDLGTPTQEIPDGFEAIPLMLSTSTPEPADYTIVGDSSMDEVVHSDLPNDCVHLLPTYTYFLHKSERNVVDGGPEKMVLAREFSKGRVLYRTDFQGRNPDFYNIQKLSIALDVPMRPVDAYGNVGDYVNNIEIGGYEGLFLIY